MERELHRAELHDRHRGGADDPRRRSRYALVNAIEALLEECDDAERVKPELLESVLEIATPPAPDTREAGAQLRGAAAQGRATRPRGAGCASARPARIRSRCGRTSAIVGRPRYRDLVTALRFVARQEIIFGLHVHVGIDDPEKAIHVANGMRVHVPVLLALSANSPFWRADATGLASTRMPIFRAFPRVGIPPAYDGLGRLRARGSGSWSTPA